MSKFPCSSCLSTKDFSFFLDYVEEIFQTFLNASKTELKEAAQKLNDKSPAPINEMLPKQSREEAVQKRGERSKMVVPPTTSGINLTKDFNLSFRKQFRVNASQCQGFFFCAFLLMTMNVLLFRGIN